MVYDPTAIPSVDYTYDIWVDPLTGEPLSEDLYAGAALQSTRTWAHDPATGWAIEETYVSGTLDLTTVWTLDADGRWLTKELTRQTQQGPSVTLTSYAWTCPP